MRRFCLSLALFCGRLAAQTDRGSIIGAVTDIRGLYIAGASLTATQLERNVQFRAVANDSGEFNLLSLPVGPYRVSVERGGFKTFIYNNVRLEAGATVRLDTTLEIGAVRQSIEVTADVTELQSDNAKIQNTMSEIMIEGLPTVVAGNMRSPFDLGGITAQVNGGDQDFRIGGGQAGSFGVMLDGASGNTNRAGSTLWAASMRLPSTPSRSSPSKPTASKPNSGGLAAGWSLLSPNPAPANITVPPSISSATTLLTRAVSLTAPPRLSPARFRRHFRRPAAHSQALSRQGPHLLLLLLRRFSQPSRRCH
jgi:hypothetical protein